VVELTTVTKAGSLRFYINDDGAEIINLAGWDFEFHRQVFVSDEEHARRALLAALDYIKNVATHYVTDEVDASRFVVNKGVRAGD
jgi:hypothetical protein